jgi:hypothetical protein
MHRRIGISRCMAIPTIVIEGDNLAGTGGSATRNGRFDVLAIDARRAGFLAAVIAWKSGSGSRPPNHIKAQPRPTYPRKSKSDLVGLLAATEPGGDTSRGLKRFYGQKNGPAVDVDWSSVQFEYRQMTIVATTSNKVTTAAHERAKVFCRNSNIVPDNGGCFPSGPPLGDRRL